MRVAPLMQQLHLMENVACIHAGYSCADAVLVHSTDKAYPANICFRCCSDCSAVLMQCLCTAGSVEARHAGCSFEGVHSLPGRLQKCHCPGVGQDLDHEQEGTQNAAS